MKLLVDTSVWSLALRRKPRDLSASERALVLLLRELIHEGFTVLIGIVRQEILSGVSDDTFDRLREYLRDFDDEPTIIEDFEEGARCRNRCVSAGIASSTTDMLICAVAIRLDLPIFTTDADFTRYAKHLPLRLTTPKYIQEIINGSRAQEPDD